MIEKKLNESVNRLLKIRENIDVTPPPVVPQVQSIETHVVNHSIPQQTIDIASLIENQTKMIIELLKQQNEIIQKLIENNNKPQEINRVPIKQEFQEKLITLKYDDKGTPIGAEITLKPFDEDKLTLEELEKGEIIKDIELGESNDN